MATAIFFQFQGPKVEGSSLMKGHEGMQEIISYSHSWEQPTNPVRSAAGGGTIEKAQHGNLQLTMAADASLTPMLGLLWSGKHIDKGTLTCYRVSGDGTVAGVPYLKVELEGIIISHLDIAGDSGDAPAVAVSLGYEKVTYTYQVVEQSKGTVAAAIPKSHDLRTNVVA